MRSLSIHRGWTMHHSTLEISFGRLDEQLLLMCPLPAFGQFQRTSLLRRTDLGRGSGRSAVVRVLAVGVYVSDAVVSQRYRAAVGVHGPTVAVRSVASDSGGRCRPGHIDTTLPCDSVLKRVMAFLANDVGQDASTGIDEPVADLELSEFGIFG